jgi:hypothetical protein
MEFKCESCQYTTTNNSNYRKHLFTDKHNKLCSVKKPIKESDIFTRATIVDTEEKITEEQKVSPSKSKSKSKVSPEVVPEVSPIQYPECKYCGKQYKHKQSVIKHIKYSCTQNKDEDIKELVRLMNIQLQNKEKELKHRDKQIESLAKQIEKLSSKLEIHGSFNTINNFNQITLLAYKDSDISHLTTEDYRSCYKKVNHCVKTLIEKVHFNPAKPENMNIRISNLKDKYFMKYDGNNWNTELKESALDDLYDDKEILLEEWLNSNPDPILKEKFNRYLENKEKDECINRLKEDIKIMIYNKRTLTNGPVEAISN